jgi:hypothetical protein
MELTGDELAGVVDLFGALTRAELGEALAELAYKRREEYDTEGFTDQIGAAVESYRLIQLDPTDLPVETDESVLVAGPGAFPVLPEGGVDLVHILDIDKREIDRQAAGRAVLDRFREDAASAIDNDTSDRVERLIDVSYELEAWADVDLSAERDHLDTTG